MAGVTFDDLVPAQAPPAGQSPPPGVRFAAPAQTPPAGPSALSFDDLVPQQPPQAGEGAPSVAVDVAKQVANLPAVATATVLGTPGDVRAMGDRGGLIDRFVLGAAHKLQDWTGFGPQAGTPERAKLDADYGAARQATAVPLPPTPTSDQLLRAIQGTGLPVPEPQTTAGRYVRAIDSFVPGMLSGPGGMARKMAADVVAPAVLSETAGQATKGTPAEPYARFLAALTGNAGSAGVRYATSAPTRAVVHALGDATPAQLAAARDLQTTGARIGVPLSGPEAIQQATGGATKLGDLLRFTEGTQRGGAVTAPFFAQRPQQVATAGNATLDAIGPASATPAMLGPRAAELAQGSIDDVRQGINTATRPAYAAAERHVVDPPDFAPIARNPAFQVSLARLRADPVLGPMYAGLPDNSGAVIDAVTKDMGARSTALGNAANPGFQPQAAAVYGSGAADAREILRDPARGGTQAYDDALTMQAQARRQNLEPLEQGALGRVANAGSTQQAYDALIPRHPLVGGQYDIGRATDSLATRDPVLAAMLIRQGLADRFDQATTRLTSGDNQGGGARFAKDVAGTAQQRANLDAVFGALPNAAPARASLDDLLDVLAATGRRRAPGSNTTADTSVGREMSLAPLPVEAMKAVRTLGTSIPGQVAERSHNFWLNRRADALGNLFVAPDSVDRIAALSARDVERPFFAAGQRSLLAPSIGALFGPRTGGDQAGRAGAR